MNNLLTDMNNVKLACEFNPEACAPEENNVTIQCPLCHHWVVLGLPHPNFADQYLPVSEAELLRLSMRAGH